MRDGAWGRRDPRGRAREQAPRGLGLWLLRRFRNEESLQCDTSAERASHCPRSGPRFHTCDDHQQTSGIRSSRNHRARELEQAEELGPCREFGHERVTWAWRSEIGQHRGGSDWQLPRPRIGVTVLDGDAYTLDTRPRLSRCAAKNSLESWSTLPHF